MKTNKKIRVAVIVLLFVSLLSAGCNQFGGGKIGQGKSNLEGNDNLPVSGAQNKEPNTGIEQNQSEAGEVIQNNIEHEDREDVRGKTSKSVQKGILVMAHSDEWIFLDSKGILEGKHEEMECDLDGNGDFGYLSISRDSPNGTKVSAVAQQIGLNLAYDIELDNAFDGFGHLEEGYGIQVTCYDLDNDGIKEVIVSTGNQSHEMQSIIYRYTKSADNPFEIVALIDGQEKMYIEDNGIITVPYGSKGLFDEYKYYNKSLYEVDMEGN